MNFDLFEKETTILCKKEETKRNRFNMFCVGKLTPWKINKILRNIINTYKNYCHSFEFNCKVSKLSNIDKLFSHFLFSLSSSSEYSSSSVVAYNSILHVTIC